MSYTLLFLSNSYLRSLYFDCVQIIDPFVNDTFGEETQHFIIWMVCLKPSRNTFQINPHSWNRHQHLGFFVTTRDNTHQKLRHYYPPLITAKQPFQIIILYSNKTTLAENFLRWKNLLTVLNT